MPENAISSMAQKKKEKKAVKEASLAQAKAED
jgi:hypothetical protein